MKLGEAQKFRAIQKMYSSNEKKKKRIMEE